jgi:hypothetical protein
LPGLGHDDSLGFASSVGRRVKEMAAESSDAKGKKFFDVNELLQKL